MQQKDNYEKDIEKYKRALLFVSILVSVLFVAGIPMIPVGFVSGYKFIGIIGIVFAGCGFYAVPLLWVGYGMTVSTSGLCHQIKVRNILDINTLCRLNNKSEKVILAQIQKLITERYLVNYILIDNHLAKMDNNQYATVDITSTLTAVCPFCGGKVPVLDGKGLCPYCGCLVTLENSKLAESATDANKLR